MLRLFGGAIADGERGVWQDTEVYAASRLRLDCAEPKGPLIVTPGRGAGFVAKAVLVLPKGPRHGWRALGRSTWFFLVFKNHESDDRALVECAGTLSRRCGVSSMGSELKLLAIVSSFATRLRQPRRRRRQAT